MKGTLRPSDHPPGFNRKRDDKPSPLSVVCPVCGATHARTCTGVGTHHRERVVLWRASREARDE